MRPVLALVVASTLVGLWSNPLPAMDMLDYFTFDGSTTNARRLDGAIESSEFRHENVPQVPLPVHLFSQYQAKHSAQVLQHEVQSLGRLDPSRKYALAPYWCPDRSGNALHNLFNTVTWAIITNRTILLQWLDDNSNHNTLPECETVLRRQPWIPTWEDWKDRLPSSTAIPIEIDVARRWFDEVHTLALFPQIPDVHFQDTDISRVSWSQHPFQPEYQAYLRDRSEPEQDRVQGLISLGIEFWYGLLFRQFFVLVPEQQQQQQQQSNDRDTSVYNHTHPFPNTQPQAITIALHSRHVAKADDGSNVQEEMNCLSRLLPKQESTIGNNSRGGVKNIPCHVFALSDRDATLDQLQEWMQVEYPSCRFHRTNQPQRDEALAHTTNTTRAMEHGPHAGRGFFQDLAMAIQARTALIGEYERSSFKLLHELITYDRTMEHSAQQQQSSSLDEFGPPDPLTICSLPYRSPFGYNYGPGSSTFVQVQESLPELYPMKLWRLYRERHDQEALEQEHAESHEWLQSGRLFAVANVTCPGLGQDQAVRAFVTRMVWSFLTNRTLLIRALSTRIKDETTCLSQLPSWLPQWEEWSSKVPDLVHPWNRLTNNETSRVLEFPPVLPVERIANNTALQPLFEFGPRFIHGMILRELFPTPMQEHSKGRTTPQQLLLRAPTVSLAVDTRGTMSRCSDENHNHNNRGSTVHTNHDNAASPSTTTVLECLSQAMASTPPAMCRVYLLADSPETVQYWSRQVELHLNEITKRRDVQSDDSNQSVHFVGCSIHPFVVSLPDESAVVHQEAAAAETTIDSSSWDWKAWAWASQARTAWIGPSSSMIADEMVYQRVLEARSIGRFPLHVPDLFTCDPWSYQ